MPVNIHNGKNMPGIAGDTDDKNISLMINPMRYDFKFSKKKTSETLIDSGNIGLGFIQRQNSSECHVLNDSSKIGLIVGFVYSGNAFFNDKDELNKKLIKGVLHSPEIVLPGLYGSFLIACTDGKKLVVATDKLATRPCFYTSHNGRLIFSSKIKGILPLLEMKSINIDCIGDLLAFEFASGDRTLVKEISSIPPATFIEWENGKIIKRRYWSFSFKYQKSQEGFTKKLMQEYESSVEKVLKTIDINQKIGIFLSGGLDSRLLFGVLIKKKIDFLTITYDTNPSGGVNPEISGKLCERFGIRNISVDFPYRIASSPELIEEAVWITEGLTPWHFFYNMDFDLNQLQKHADVIINNPRQGEFFGEDLSMDELTSGSDIVEILRNNIRVFRNPAPESLIESLLSGKYSIKSEIQKEICKSDKKSGHAILLDAMYANYYPAFYRENIAANLVDFRNIFSSAGLLNQIAGIPLDLRLRNLPLIKKIPMYPVSPLKLELIRNVNMGLEKIPYERTGTAPENSMAVHFIRYMKRSIIRRNAYNFGRLIREERLKKCIYAEIEPLCSRDLINSEAIYDILEKHMNGKADHGRLIGSLTTAGLFIEKAFK